jgi:hypothetical protein
MRTTLRWRSPVRHGCCHLDRVGCNDRRALAVITRVAIPALRAGLQPFENWLTAGLAALAALAIVWQGIAPVLLLPPCP